MEIEVNLVLGVLGIMLAVVEVWRPRLSVKLEEYIDKQISEIKQFQTLYIKEFRTLAKIADGSVKEALKGPQLVTSEEFKANTYTSITNIKSYLWFYFVTIVNFIVLKPARSLLVFLNKIGRGRAVGGLGIVLGILSTFL